MRRLLYYIELQGELRRRAERDGAPVHYNVYTHDDHKRRTVGWTDGEVELTTEYNVTDIRKNFKDGVWKKIPLHNDIFLESNALTNLVRDSKLKAALFEKGVSLQIRKLPGNEYYDTLHISVFHPDEVTKEELRPLIQQVSDEIAERYGFFELRTTYQNTFE